MLHILTNSSKPVLQPIERISEILFGLIMVLTFTCSLSVADAGRTEVRALLVGALGCNLAWGIIDAVFYLMDCFAIQGRGILTLQSLRQVSNPAQAQGLIAQALPPVLVSVLSASDFELMQQKLNGIADVPERPRLNRKDWVGAAGVFLSVVLATFPVVIPYVLISDVKAAVRVSNGVAILMLFLAGYAFGKYAGHRPLSMATAMVLLGAGLVAITIFLGG
jgi:hypothetical protein